MKFGADYSRFKGESRCIFFYAEGENDFIYIVKVLGFLVRRSSPNRTLTEMSDTAKVSTIAGQQVWAAVSVVFCVAVILVFFFILCCAYRRHRRVRDISMFTPTASPQELASYSTPWIVSTDIKEKGVSSKWTAV